MSSLIKASKSRNDTPWIVTPSYVKRAMRSATFFNYDCEGQHNTVSPRARSRHAIGLKFSSTKTLSSDFHPAARKRYNRLRTGRRQHFDLRLPICFILALFFLAEVNTCDVLAKHFRREKGKLLKTAITCVSFHEARGKRTCIAQQQTRAWHEACCEHCCIAAASAHRD